MRSFARTDMESKREGSYWRLTWKVIINAMIVMAIMLINHMMPDDTNFAT